MNNSIFDESLAHDISGDLVAVIKKCKETTKNKTMYLWSFEHFADGQRRAESELRFKTLEEGEFVNLTREEYWVSILRAKVEVACKIGGYDLMYLIYKKLKEHPEDAGLNLSGLYNHYVDGIGDWDSDDIRYAKD